MADIPNGSALKPCVHCGVTDLEILTGLFQPNDRESFCVKCKFCTSCGPQSVTIDGAIRYWNLRMNKGA